MQVNGIIHVELKVEVAKGSAHLNSGRYEFTHQEWVDVDPSRDFARRLGPVGIDSTIATSGDVGDTRVTVFKPKPQRLESVGGTEIVHIFDNWTIESGWLCVLSLPVGAALKHLRVRDFEGELLRMTTGLGTDHRLCYYFFSSHARGLRIEARAHFDRRLYEAVSASVGTTASQERFDPVQQARVAHWQLSQDILNTVEDPPGISWTTYSATKLAHELGAITRAPMRGQQRDWGAGDE